jgi:branched-chain amino acid transport system permease protein
MPLDLILNVVVQGLMTGLVYGLMALGLSVIFGVVHVVNFAHGEIYMAGCYAALFTVNALFAASAPAFIVLAA